MKRLLFVEDDIVIGNVYRYHFESAGYSVELAEDGEKALEALRRFAPDVVVLDLLLPKVSGVDLLKRLRANPETRSLPIIVFTNAFAGSLAQEAKNAGATLLLDKAKTGSAELLSAVAATLNIALPATGTTTVSVRVLSPSSKTPVTPPETPSTKRAPADVRQEFLVRAPQVMAELQQTARQLVNEGDPEARRSLVLELEIKVHALSSGAALHRALPLGQMASALDVLLWELCEKPSRLNESTIRTVHQAVDFLPVLFERASSSVQESMRHRILAVDDEPIARKAVQAALARAQLTAVSVEDPLSAYTLLQKESFDLVITDVNMPGMDGFQLCRKLRALPQNSKTPVIFVTVLNGFAERVRSASSGGDDFIAKPFMAMELAVKALIHLVRGRLPESAPVFRSFRPGS